MTFVSGRRLIPACIVAAAAAVALTAPGAASATPTPDLLTQCAGSNIEGIGSSFQNPILQLWGTRFNISANLFACNGTQGSFGKPVVKYGSGGSGACLHAWGAEAAEARYGEVAFCGTDEAPNATQKAEMESHAEAGIEAKSIETIPTMQGSVAVIVHLPAGCKASSEIEKSGKKFLLGRLVLDNSSIEGVYRGTITTWKELLAHQVADGNSAKDALTCSGGTAEEEDTITPVVRLDKSGTTHLFKAYLLQVSSTPMLMEEYPETLSPAGRGKSGCTKSLPEEETTWSQVSEGCENQRWPKAAKVVFGTEKGNPGVVKRVNEVPSSIGYADLAVAREYKFFSANCKVTPLTCGGENKKGSELKRGEQNTKFWAEVQDTTTPSISGYADPSSDGDVEKLANSNCKSTIYINEVGTKFPPASTRELWNQAKAQLVQAKYNICGLTYDLALRQYKFYPGGTTKEEATTVENFLRWAVNAKAEGGQTLKATDYEKLPGTIVKIAEKGIEEIGYVTA